MSTYQRTETVEAMQWKGVLHGSDDDDVLNWTLVAERIVAWINANGGEARYESAVSITGCSCDDCQHPARIGVRQPRGHSIYAAPGDWIVRGDSSFYIRTAEQFAALGWQPKIDITRVSLIDHRSDGKGLLFEICDVTINTALQDDGRTLKVFITD